MICIFNFISDYKSGLPKSNSNQQNLLEFNVDASTIKIKTNKQIQITCRKKTLFIALYLKYGLNLTLTSANLAGFGQFHLFPTTLKQSHPLLSKNDSGKTQRLPNAFFTFVPCLDGEAGKIKPQQPNQVAYQTGLTHFSAR